MRPMRIAIYQGQGQSADTEKNLGIMRRVAIEAAGRGARLVIFPEMFLTGYNIGDAVFELAEVQDGASAQKASQIARGAGVALLYGYPEQFETMIFNAAILIDSEGKALANCRKTHLYGAEEKRLFSRGDALTLAELEGLNIGILVCYDVEFPETVRALSLAGADFIAVPTALMQPYCMIARIVVPARAYESQVAIAYVNRCGCEGNLTYCGLSCIVGPDGEDLQRAGSDEALLITSIDHAMIEAARQENPILGDLRPDLYQGSIGRGLS